MTSDAFKPSLAGRENLDTPSTPPPPHGRHHYEKFPWMLTMLIIHCKVWMAFVSMQNSGSFPWSSLEDVRCGVGTDAFNFFESWSVFKGTGELDYVRGLAGGRCTSVEVDLFWSFSPHPPPPIYAKSNI